MRELSHVIVNRECISTVVSKIDNSISLLASLMLLSQANLSIFVWNIVYIYIIFSIYKLFYFLPYLSKIKLCQYISRENKTK